MLLLFSPLKRVIAVMAIATLCTTGALAQRSPTPDHVTPQIDRALSSPTDQPQVSAVPEQSVDHSGPLVRIQKFLIEGATYIPTEELERTFEQYRGEQMYLGELQQAAQKLVEVYRERGRSVRVVVPEQDIHSGTLRILVIER